jgi:thiol-disulfide isomerase/thioredoxin
MHEFPPGLTWFNVEKPLKASDLADKVVLVDFWTYSCINCIRTMPFLKEWYSKYKKYGFEIIGIHTPEFDFERDIFNVKNAIKYFEIDYPVVLDNDLKLWTIYNNHYWPAHYIYDTQGKLRYTHFGEGEYEKTEEVIQNLLKENGKEVTEPVIQIKPSVDFSKIGSPETYLGYNRMVGFASPEELDSDIPQKYSIPSDIKKNRVYFEGLWEIKDDRAILKDSFGRIVYRYSANKINLVMGTNKGSQDKKQIKVCVLMDGQKLDIGNKGDDIDERGCVNVQEHRLYNLINTHNYYEVHTCEILFHDAGIEVFAFTFG